MEKGMASQHVNGDEVEPVAFETETIDDVPAPAGMVGRAAKSRSGSAPGAVASGHVGPAVTSGPLPLAAPPAASQPPAAPPPAAQPPAAPTTQREVVPPPALASDALPTGLVVPQAVPDDEPVGVRKYVYVKGVGRVRWRDLRDDNKKLYRQHSGLGQSNEPDTEPATSTEDKPADVDPGFDEVIT